MNAVKAGKPSMEQQAFEEYSTAFVQALAAFDNVMGVVALGSTADPAIQDSWSDHDFAVVLRDGDSGKFLTDVSWMPKTEKIIAWARHGGIYNVAVYDDGHKVEYLVCNEQVAGSITVTKFLVFLDRSDVGRRIEEAKACTSARQQAMSEDACNPINLAIMVLTAGQRVQRGELLNATSLLAAASDMALKMLATTQRWELTDPLDPRRRLERQQPHLAKELSDILTASLDNAIHRLLSLIDTTIRPKTSTRNWSGFDSVLRILPLPIVTQEDGTKGRKVDDGPFH
jgi:hypothetical protein